MAGMAALATLELVPRAIAAAAGTTDAPAHPLADRLAVYADALRFDDLDATTAERIKTHVIDTIGCGIGAFDEKPVRICRDLALSVSGPATIIGTNRRTSPELASFANGAAFRYLDFNDAYVGRFAIHPSDQIAACLAVAETERASAQDLITAIAIAYEVNCRLVDAFDISTRGWDPPVLSLPAVALAAGKLMKLGPERLTHAVNLAINDHIPMAQTRVQTLSDWKGLADAEAGRNAVFAALLARGGLTGPSPIFEGDSGHHAPRLPADRCRTGEMVAADPGHRRPQPSLRHRAGNVRRRLHQRKLRAAQVSRAERPCVHAQDQSA
jgi:2-methylcitrate dehydratase